MSLEDLATDFLSRSVLEQFALFRETPPVQSNRFLSTIEARQRVASQEGKSQRTLLSAAILRGLRTELVPLTEETAAREGKTPDFQHIEESVSRLEEIKGHAAHAEEVREICSDILPWFDLETGSDLRASMLIFKSSALLDLGRQSGDMDLLAKSLACSLEATSIYEEQDPSDLAMAKHNLANAMLELGDRTSQIEVVEEAIATYEEALSLNSKTREFESRITILKRRADAILCAAQMSGSILRLKQAVDDIGIVLQAMEGTGCMESWSGCKMQESNALIMLGGLKDDASLVAKGISGYDAILESGRIERASSDWDTIQQNRATGLNSLGELTASSDTLKLAASEFEKIISNRIRKGDETASFIQYVNLGNARQRLAELTGDPEEARLALASFDRAVDICQNEKGSRRWATAFQNLATTKFFLGKLVEDEELVYQAIAGFNACLKIFDIQQTPAAWSMAQFNRANALGHLGQMTNDSSLIEEAIRLHDLALKARGVDESPSEHASSRQSQANHLAVLGARSRDPILLRKAVDGHRVAIDLTDPEKNPENWAAATQNLAAVYHDLYRLTGESTELDTALELLRNAKAPLSFEKTPDAGMTVARPLATLLVERGEYDEARSRLDEALEGGLAHLVRVENRAARERAIEQAAGLAELRAWIAIAQDADAGTALTYLERGRAQLLALSLAEDPEKAFAKGLAELGDLLAAIPAEGAAVLPIIGPSGAQVAVVPGGRTSVTPEDFLDLPDLTRVRFQGWFFGPEDEPGLGGYLRAYQEGRLAWADPQAEPELARLFPETLSATLAEIWVHLLGPVDARLRELGLAEGAPVTIMPPGLMGLLPLWAAAPEDRADGAPFGSRWTVSLAPSLTALRAARRRSAGWEEAEAPVRTLAVLDPASKGQRRLPGAALEGRLLAQILGPDRVTALGGEDATAAAMTGAMAGRSHLHLSMHGFFSPNLPDQSALLLAGEDRLTLRALQELEAAEQLRLVVLSACDSGLPGLQRGRIDEFIGLPAGFLQAGAAAVIASHWPVRDDAAFFLMWRFYREYLDETGRERQSPAAALKAASLWLRDVTLGELATLFEPAQDADGPVPFTIDRSKPRQTPEPKADRAPPATALTLDAHLRAAPSRHKPADEAPKGPVNDALYDRIDRVKKDNANVYILDPSGKDPTHHKPFNAPTLWAAFSVTGV